MGIEENLALVRDRIAAACEQAGRSQSDITLVGVSKGQPPETVCAAYDAGLREFGENRVQEALPKIQAVATSGRTARWHLVGHLQTNKAQTVIGAFDILESVDSVRLAQALSRRASRPVPILLEVNVAQEATKFGFTSDDLPQALDTISQLPNIDVEGLMTVAPVAGDPEQVRPVFRHLRELRDAAGLRELSMGMTDDLEVAIEEGATIVRVGRAIFGARQEA